MANTLDTIFTLEKPRYEEKLQHENTQLLIYHPGEFTYRDIEYNTPPVEFTGYCIYDLQ